MSTGKISEVWIDTLEFDKKGGWKEDTQFVHIMGSGYLIAADEPGKPVDDAEITVNIAQKGNYRIWVRTRNWMRSHSPGKFTVLVNGETKKDALGTMPSDDWVWEIAGDFELEKGLCQIALHDLTGYFARCASILLTTDLDYVPPREIERMQKERARIKGINADVTDGGKYDVIVAGGGPGGVPAAVSCARMGYKVLIIHNRSVLGGNASSEIGIPSYGAEVAHPYSREGGIAEEIMRLRDREPECVGEWTRAMEKLVSEEKNITVIYNAHVCDVKMKNASNIESVVALDVRNLTKTQYRASLFIDCTGDAWVGYYAGAKYRYGREAQYEHNESFAPLTADTLTMSGCVRSGNIPYFVDAGEEITFTLPEWAPKLPENEEDFGRVIKGPRVHWWMEAPNDYDDIYDGEETRDELLLILLSVYDHMKNHWSKKDTVKNYKLNVAGIVNGRRESRRLIGDYVLTQDDCISGKKFDDVVSYSGWALDIHHPKGIYSGKEGPLYCAAGVPLVNVPYRCLYSKNIDNLLFAGRNVSATHIAIGTLRVQLTIMTLGQAVGTAAALCLKYKETPRGIYERHIRELQQTLIKNDQYIPGLKNEDITDPSLKADVTASSVCNTEEFSKQHGTKGPLISLDMPRATIFGVSSRKGNIENVYLRLYSENDEPIQVTAYASMEGDLDTVSQTGEIFSAEATVMPKCESWIRFPLNITSGGDVRGEYLRVWINKTDGLYWRSIENLSFYRMIGEMDCSGKWKMTMGKSYYSSLAEPKEIIANCEPQNVNNGYSRILNENCYEWVSDPNESLPQWIELTFEKPEKINMISIVFDTDMNNPATCRDYKFPFVKNCVKDYIVEIYDGKKWNKIADEVDNFMRKRNHCFKTTKTEKIRVSVLKTAGSKSARIIEIRASLETR